MEIECSGSGGFGIFFSNQQLITLLKHILKDNINILKAVMQGMHECIRETIINIISHHTVACSNIGLGYRVHAGFTRERICR